jgi:hypothetical protein
MTHAFTRLTAAITLLVTWQSAAAQSGGRAPDTQFDDSHFHLTNYVQEGTDIRDFLRG